MARKIYSMRFAAVLLIALISVTGCASERQTLSETPPAETVGEGTIESPAIGPGPAFGIGGDGCVLVKNWDFGTEGTVRNIDNLNAQFQYHDQFGTIGNGVNYGAKIVSPDLAHALPDQPVEHVNTAGPVREFFAGSMRTYLVPLNGATEIVPKSYNLGSGSFHARWKLPAGGSVLNQDIIWETRVRYVTPPYFWFALWTAGNKWKKGAEMDLVESFGYDNGGGATNFDGRNWHSSSVGGTDNVNYKEWSKGMTSRGVTEFDASKYHVWTWHYRKDNTYSAYMDGIEVQSGVIHWTVAGVEGGEPIDMNFLFDGTWAHTKVPSVNSQLPSSAFIGKFYEWDYSRVYLKN